jgi:D-alanyl-D-alanine dipeptidase|nr:M15 family metallopeptidase [Kofleriaceae bacterium]
MSWLAVACVLAGCGPGASDADLVELAVAIPDAVLDLRYATANNFTGAPLYDVARCKLRRAVLRRVVRAADALRADGRRLVVWDCYRPRHVQAVLWKRVPDARYVADPAVGSRHSHGAAIDCAVAAADGSALVLPTAFDDFTDAAHRDHALAGTRGAEARRLEAAMTAAGFVGLPTEWWHFDAPDADRYPLSDEAL